MSRTQVSKLGINKNLEDNNSDLNIRKKSGMRIFFSEEKIISASDALDIIFPNKKTQTAARIFSYWLKEKGGKATKTAVSMFAEKIDQGVLDSSGKPFRYSKRNFYLTVLRTLISMGFIRRNVPIWDDRSKKTLYVYMRNLFDIPQKPPSIGFWKLSFYIARKWNRIFLD